MFSLKVRLVAGAAAVGSALVIGSSSVFAAGPADGKVFDNNDRPPQPVAHAFATQDRDSGTITLHVHDRGLIPGATYNGFAAVFPDAAACKGGTPGISMCKPGVDKFTGESPFSFTANPAGNANFEVTVAAPSTAEVQLVYRSAKPDRGHFVVADPS